MKIAFIGVGNIGFPMAQNLVAAGHALTIHDLARAKAEPLLAKGARWADSAAEAARGAEIVMTSLPGPPQVRAVMDGGLLAAMESGAIWLEMSTTDIEQLRRMAKAAEARGVETLECPVTGGVRNAYKGKISIFCGGERATFERARPVLAGTSEKQFYLGPLGAAMTAKLVTNMLCFIHEMALAEGLMIGKQAGLDLREFVEAIQSSYGASFVAGTDSAKIFDGTYNTTFALSHALKDMRLTTQLGQESGVPLALARFVQGHMERAEARFGGSADCLAVVQMLEADSGIALRA
ncbi:MAG: NAD(P)-dependent oxidoreductase [Alphaproteobacteria bacterium]